MARKIFLFFISIFLAVFITEVILRYSGYSDRYFYDPIYVEYPENDNIPYVHKQDLKEALGRSKTIFDTDALGVRTNNQKRLTESDLNVVVLGDSFTFGQGVSSEDTFVAVTERASREEGFKANVFNLGISGYSVKEMVAVALEQVIDTKPDFLVMAIIAEDFDLTRAGEVDSYGYTHTTGSLSKDSKVKLFLRQLAISYIVRDIYMSLTIPDYLGRTRSVNVDEEAAYRYVKKLPETARKLGAQYILVLLPSKADPGQFDNLKPKLKEDGIITLDLSGLVNNYTDKEFCLNRFDCHPKYEVHQEIGQELSRYLIAEVSKSQDSPEDDKD